MPLGVSSICWVLFQTLFVSHAVGVGAVPSGFPASGNAIWYDRPGLDWATQYLPIGNGYLAGMVNGNVTVDRIQLNIESLWTGGLFQNSSYNGGNHQYSEAASLATELARIRQTIFSSPNATISNIMPLGLDPAGYGTYTSPGYLSVNRSVSGNLTYYSRWLDLDTAVLRTEWTEPSGSFNRTYFCSNPSRACTVHTVASTPGSLSSKFSLNPQAGIPLPNITCLDQSTLQLRGHVASPGMLYEILAKVQQHGPANSSVGCTVDPNGKALLFVDGATEARVTWVGNTEFSMDTGNAASGFTFKGPDPHSELVRLLDTATEGSVQDASRVHIADYKDANINLQMNYWMSEMTNLNVTTSLWDYMSRNWAPRGAETAKILYGANGWIVHDEMNIFGHSGMKYAPSRYITPQSANYPEAPAWMMTHLYDHFDYTGDVAWWRTQGWPLLKGVALFWLDHLIEDMHFRDGTLVTAPCNSPEQPAITFACANSQQLVWQLFEAVEKGFGASGDTNKTLLAEVQNKKARLDKGVKIGSWGQLQEWKVEFDNPKDTHRHLSHLVGLFPGYVLSNFKSSIANLTREQVIKAAEVTLASRGNGTGPDGDAGWEKIWRAACWAQLKNSAKFYHQLTYAIERNFAGNLWSLYDSNVADPIFQIDANLGYPAAVLNAIIQAPDTSSLSDVLRITILPALPAAWSAGFITGTKIRGGMSLDLKWANSKPVYVDISVGSSVWAVRPVQVWYAGKVVGEFSTTAGLRKRITSF
ncbi:glycoside hydrolase family 95 protein [Ceratobasidium sp. AG-Ba]|nr:glycoside hydrolase family 95 protein [Ceratobasidium sp. AG-Ba]